MSSQILSFPVWFTFPVASVPNIAIVGECLNPPMLLFKHFFSFSPYFYKVMIFFFMCSGNPPLISFLLTCWALTFLVAASNSTGLCTGVSRSQESAVVPHHMLINSHPSFVAQVALFFSEAYLRHDHSIRFPGSFCAQLMTAAILYLFMRLLNNICLFASLQMHGSRVHVLMLCVPNLMPGK